MVGMAEMWHQLVWMGWQSIWTVGVSACDILILHQNIQKMAKCTIWYQLTRVVLDKVRRSVKWLCVYVCVCTWVSQYQKGETKINLDFLQQETVGGSRISWAICKSAPCPRQITMPVPHHSVFYRSDALPAAQPTVKSRHSFVLMLWKSFSSVGNI